MTYLRWGLIALTVAAVVALLVIFRQPIMAVLSPFIVALGVAYILNPVAQWLQQYKIPPLVSVLIIYLLFFGLVTLLLILIIPVVIEEVNHLIEQIPEYIETAKDLLARFNEAFGRLELPQSVQEALDAGLKNLEKWLLDSLTRIPGITTNLARGVFNVFLVLILTFYFIKDFTLIRRGFFSLVPDKNKPRVRKIYTEIDSSLGNYIRGQLLICTIVGLSTYIGLLLLGVDFALILGIIVGITNIIPYFGPFIGAMPVIIVALLTSPLLALKAALVMVAIQQVESHFLSPQILGKSVGLHPALVILALIAGGQFFGIIGMILAVPTAAVIRILVYNLWLAREQSSA